MKKNTRKSAIDEAVNEITMNPTMTDPVDPATSEPVVEAVNGDEVTETKAETAAEETASEPVSDKPAGTEPVSDKAAKKEKRVRKPKKEKAEKTPKILVKQMTNEELAELFTSNGCVAKSKAKSNSAVYNTFGTQSRILQLKGAYQLLLTNGHQKVKDQVVACDNDDVARFLKWYDMLEDAEKVHVIGAGEVDKTKLSVSELPRERSVKINDLGLLVTFIQYMATFDENKLVAAVAE
jgi:hypothetical protein